MVVLINSNNQILCNNEFIDIKQLKDKVREFIENPYNDEHKPEKVEIDVPFFGKQMVTKIMLSLCKTTAVRNTRHTLTYRTNWQQPITN